MKLGNNALLYFAVNPWSTILKREQTLSEKMKKNSYLVSH